MEKVAVVLLNYNGKKYLEQFLPLIIKYSESAVIYLADNASIDDSVKFVRSKWPQIRIIPIPVNEGYSEGYNQALSTIEAEYYVLLNTDVEVTNGWLDPVINFLDQHSDVAAAQPKILSYVEKHKFEYAGACGGFMDHLGYPFCRGRIFLDLEEDNGQYDDKIEVFWATGACLFIRSEVFHQAGGFDKRFFAHMEEIDLCWRMQHMGYKVFVIPESKVYHIGGGTLPKSNPRKTYLNFRNGLLMIYKNYPSEIFFKKYFARMFLDILAAIKFLLFDSSKDFAAVIEAHFNFWAEKKHSKKSKYMKNPNPARLILPRSVVWEYYIKKSRKFSQIKW